MKLKTAVVQMNITRGNKEANKQKIRTLLTDLPEDCDFLVLPELWNIGYDTAQLPALAETVKGESIEFLREIAVKYRVNVIGGSIAEKKEDGIFNMMPVIGRRGELLHKYRKAHLFPLDLNEPAFFEAGDEWGLCETDCGVIGLMLCYDLRFPAFCRNLASRKAEIIFVAAQWPAARAAHFHTLLQARAIENEVFMVGVNRTGSDCAAGREDIAYNGHSLIVCPDGTLLLECSGKETLAICEFDTSAKNDIREKIPVYSDRKNILDEIDNNMI